MKIKRFLAWLLVFAMCFMMVSCQNNTSNEDASTTKNIEQTTETTTVSQDETAKPILYRVSDDNGNVIWLFGSIHVGREDYYPLPDYVLNAFDSADSLAVEADIVAFEKNTKLQMKAMSQLLYSDGSSIADHIPQELYDKSVEILKENKAYMPAMDYYCPALWSSMIESLMIEEMGGDINLGIDRHLIDRAYDTEKEILEIESAEFQYKMLADFDDDIQIMLLQSAIEMYEDKDTASADMKEMMDLWASGDENAFISYLTITDDTMTDEEKRIYEKYNQELNKEEMQLENKAEEQNENEENVNKVVQENQQQDKKQEESETQRDVIKAYEKSKWRIEIPRLNLNVHILEGTTSDVLLKAVGHFESTSSWNGNVGLAAHNRGYNCNFFQNIKNLKEGDEIIYYTSQGKRVYKVTTNKIIQETNWDYLQKTEDNRITLITCEENRKTYRRCVQAIEASQNV